MLHAILAGEEHRTARTFTVTNPATLEVVSEVADCGEEEARQAIEASVQALKSWRRTNPYERAALLMRWHDRVLAEQDILARRISTEMGKPISEARGEIAFSASFLSYYAEEAKRLPGQIVPSHTNGKRLLVVSQPVGVVYAITPWNFPASMLARKVAPALAAGCTFILKPADLAPGAALHLARLWHEVGGPSGVLQVLPTRDPARLTRVMMDDPRVRKLTFTGSTAVGQQLAAQCAPTLKRVSLELGGHAPFIVFEDADLDAAVNGAIASKFRNAGQTCVCANRLYVQRGVQGEFSRRLHERMTGLRLGDPLDPATEVGPLVSAPAREKARAHIENARALGASVQAGAQTTDLPGYYLPPTLLSGVSREARINREETFGPVAPLMPFDTEEEALALANDSEYGLAAYFYTTNLDRLFRVSEALEYGLIGINDPLPSTAQAPFGGVKQSGYGREGGSWGLAEYLDTKFLSVGVKG